MQRKCLLVANNVIESSVALLLQNIVCLITYCREHFELHNYNVILPLSMKT